MVIAIVIAIILVIVIVLAKIIGIVIVIVLILILIFLLILIRITIAGRPHFPAPGCEHPGVHPSVRRCAPVRVTRPMQSDTIA